MDIEKCRALVTILETGSLSAAAAKLGYTPSGISRMMASLETETGFPLLCRGRNGASATRECETLLPTIRHLISLADQYKAIAGELCGLEEGTIKLGTSYHAYYKWFAKLIADFGKIYPGVNISILEGTSSELRDMLSDREIDFCLISYREGEHRWISLFQDALVAWVPENHPAVKTGRFTKKDLAREPFIEIYPGQETDNSRFFESCKVKPVTRYSTLDTYAAYSMVEAGLGFTLVNSLFVDSWKGKVAVVPLDPPQTVDIGIATAREDTLSPAAKRFIEFAVDSLQLP